MVLTEFRTMTSVTEETVERFESPYETTSK